MMVRERLHRRRRDVADRISTAADRPVSTAALVASKIVFFVILVGLALAAASAGSVLATLVIGAIASLWLRVIFPSSRIKQLGRYFWEGDAGEDAVDSTSRLGGRR